jgi:hypothetical protein
MSVILYFLTPSFDLQEHRPLDELRNIPEPGALGFKEAFGPSTSNLTEYVYVIGKDVR